MFSKLHCCLPDLLFCVNSELVPPASLIFQQQYLPQIIYIIQILGASIFVRQVGWPQYQPLLAAQRQAVTNNSQILTLLTHLLPLKTQQFFPAVVLKVYSAALKLILQCCSTAVSSVQHMQHNLLVGVTIVSLVQHCCVTQYSPGCCTIMKHNNLAVVALMYKTAVSLVQHCCVSQPALRHHRRSTETCEREPERRGAGTPTGQPAFH